MFRLLYLLQNLEQWNQVIFLTLTTELTGGVGLSRQVAADAAGGDVGRVDHEQATYAKRCGATSVPTGDESGTDACDRTGGALARSSGRSLRRRRLL